MKKIISPGISILLFLSCFFTAHAQAPLSEADINNFMNAMKPLQILGQKYDIDENKAAATESKDFTDFAPMSRALADVKDNEVYEEFEEIILKAGFSSPQEWATVGDRIMRAYTSYRIIKDMTPEKSLEMLKSIEEVKKNQYLSPDIKQQLLKSLTQAIKLADNLTEGTKADQETLKPYLARLERLFEE